MPPYYIAWPPNLSKQHQRMHLHGCRPEACGPTGRCNQPINHRFAHLPCSTGGESCCIIVCIHPNTVHPQPALGVFFSHARRARVQLLWPTVSVRKQMQSIATRGYYSVLTPHPSFPNPKQRWHRPRGILANPRTAFWRPKWRKTRSVLHALTAR